jgi:hypothetical protein
LVRSWYWFPLSAPKYIVVFKSDWRSPPDFANTSLYHIERQSAAFIGLKTATRGECLPDLLPALPVGGGEASADFQ